MPCSSLSNLFSNKTHFCFPFSPFSSTFRLLFSASFYSFSFPFPILSFTIPGLLFHFQPSVLPIPFPAFPFPLSCLSIPSFFHLTRRIRKGKYMAKGRLTVKKQGRGKERTGDISNGIGLGTHREESIRC